MTDDGLVALKEMPQLTGLLLDCAPTHPLTDAALRHLAHLPKLSEFNLKGAAVTGTGLRHVADPTSVEELSFDDTPITDEGLKTISRFPNLRRLMVWRKSTISDEGLKSLRVCRRLEDLDLALCNSRAITNAVGAALCQLPALESLSLVALPSSDICVDYLLRMPRLKCVQFGGAISVDSFERLRAAGIAVEHGGLKDFRRATNVLRYMDIDFGIDPEQSALRAYMHPDYEDVSWEIEIRCLNEYLPKMCSPARLDGPLFGFKGTWRELQGREFRIVFDEDELHPIRPGTPANIYVNWHAAPNNHLIRFLERDGARFLIEWTCVAKEIPEDDEHDVYVLGDIEFKELIVFSERTLSLDDARHIAARKFDPADFDAPQLDEGARDVRYVFAVKAGE
ncbi:MAG: hypothetical protein WD066_14740 [Planctomycetaceae bacterium]